MTEPDRGTGTTIGAVLFDFGGVFIDSPFAVVQERLADLGFDPLTALEHVFGPYHADTDHAWHALERGEISFEDAREAIRASTESGLGRALDPIELMAKMATGGGLRDWMVDGVRTLRLAGIATAVVTNNAREFGPFWRPLLPLDELFDVVVDSSEVGFRKPDERIYRLTCERLGVAPADALFIDDFEGNVTGARAAGLEAICCGYTVHTAQEALAAVLERCGCPGGPSDRQ